MAAVTVSPPYALFTDSDGTALENGYIYIGTAGLDPETNELQAYWDLALTIPATQPIRTVNGYYSNAGTPADIFVDDDDFSITVQDSSQSLIFTKLNYSQSFPFTTFLYTPKGVTSPVDRDIADKLSEFVSVKDFGAEGDAVTDDTAAFTLAEAQSTEYIFLPDGTYVVTGLTLDKNYWGPGTIRLDATDRPHYLANSRPQTVTVFPPSANLSNVLLPDGTWLDVSSTTTSGLQEAIDYALGDGTVASGSFDLHICGSEKATTGDAVVYSCTTVLTFPQMEGRKVTAGGCVFDFSSAITTTTAIQFNSMLNCVIDLRSVEVISDGTGHVVGFDPQTALPVDTDEKIVTSEVMIGSIVNTNNSTTGDAGALVEFSANNEGIRGNTFVFRHMNQSGTDTASIGILNNDPAVGSKFEDNTIVVNKGEGCAAGFLKNGTTTAATSRSESNTWRINAQGTSQAGSRFIATFGSGDMFHVNTRGNTYAVGLRVESTCVDNVFHAGRLEATTTVDNQETTDGANVLFRASPLEHVSLNPLSGPPHEQHNATMEDYEIIMQGGTYSGNTFISPNGTTFYDTGMQDGIYRVPAGATVRINYSSTPNTRLIKKS